jgi:CHRD domain-containing protein
MHRSLRWWMLTLVPVLMLGLNSVSADPGHGHGPKADPPKPDKGPKPDLQASLSGSQEVPFVVSDGQGTFEATLNDAGDQLTYTLRYSGLNGNVAQAHIHVGQRFVAAGISVFLCTNLSGGPAGTQACPSAPAQISGTITAANVIGPTAQGVGPGDLTDLLAAIKAGQAYVNVHSDLSPGGEIRGQLHFHPPGGPMDGHH